MTPEIPGNAEAEQVRAWVEWAELALDPDFRAGMRRTAEDHAAEQAHCDTELPCLLLARLESVNDPRRDRYFQLLAVMNGWPAPQNLTPAFAWSAQAVRARMER